MVLTCPTNNSLKHHFPMPESQLSGSRKRQRSEQSPPQLKRASQPLSKRQHSSYQTPPAFWDNLSKLWLTKRALREQDRRIAQSASNTPSLIRHALTELKKDRQPTQFAPELLYNYSPRCLKDIKLLARHGGPNLEDLRGVCFVKYPLMLVLVLTILGIVFGTCQSL